MNLEWPENNLGLWENIETNWLW